MQLVDEVLKTLIETADPVHGGWGSRQKFPHPEAIDFALVIGTPPTMVAYSTRLFTAGRIFRVGILLDVLGLALLVTVVIWIWELLGIV